MTSVLKTVATYTCFLANPALLGALPTQQSPVPTPPACALQGTVRDQTGVPVPGVTVSLDTERTTTDAHGRYCFASAPEKGKVEAVLTGFAIASRDFALATTPRLAVDFTLIPSGFKDDVVVTATRTNRRLEDVPVRTEVVDSRAMQAIGARTLADAVEYTTGVRVESNCQNCNFSQIRLLGLEGPYTQILIDGQPVISSLAQVYGIEQIPSRMIQRIEIVKGGGSALYGSGSVGGVVNIIPREPSRPGGLFESRVDWTRRRPNMSHSGSFDWAASDQRANLMAFAQIDEVKPLDLTGDGFTEVSLRRLRAAGARSSRYFFGGSGKLTGEFTMFGEERRGGDRLDRPPQEALIAEWIDTRRTAGSATWFHSVGPRLDYRATLAVADTARDSYYGTGQDPNAFGDTANRLVVADSQVNQYAGRHTVSWGVQATWESLRDAQPSYARFTDATYRNTGIFVQDDWAFAKGWELIYGLRADRHSAVDTTIVSPRVALMISPNEALDIRASVARGFRAPQTFDEDLHLSSVGGDVRFIRLDPSLREERSTNYMLGAEWKPEAGRGQALVEINGFLTALDDLFFVRQDDDPATGALEYRKVNHGRARVYGVEMNAGWGIGDAFVLQGGVVVQRARHGEPEPDFGSPDFFRTPHHYGNLSLTWTTARLGTFFTGLRYTGRMKVPHLAGFVAADRLDTAPAFVTLDASLAVPLRVSGARRLTLTVAGRNLTNQFQRDVDQGPLRDASYVYGPRFPRSISLGFRAEF